MMERSASLTLTLLLTVALTVAWSGFESRRKAELSLATLSGEQAALTARIRAAEAKLASGERQQAEMQAVLQGLPIPQPASFSPAASAEKVPDEATVLHEIEDVLNELALIAHCRGILPANTFNRAPKQAAVIKLLLRKAVIAQLVGFNFKSFREPLDLPSQLCILLARNNGHAASRVSSDVEARIGSNNARAIWRTTGTTTPSPVKWYASL